MHDPVRLLTIQFLEWVAHAPRTYADAMDAWRTSCPRLPVWEDAIENNLVRIERLPKIPMGDCPLVLTPQGRTALHAARIDA